MLGAVMGLIHVMENLSDPSKLGAGIAVAFVATIYGVGSANLIFLPMAKKLLASVGDLVNVLAARRWPVAPLVAVNRSELTPLGGKLIIGLKLFGKIFNARFPLVRITSRNRLALLLQIMLIRPLIPNVDVVVD